MWKNKLILVIFATLSFFKVAFCASNSTDDYFTEFFSAVAKKPSLLLDTFIAVFSGMASIAFALLSFLICVGIFVLIGFAIYFIILGSVKGCALIIETVKSYWQTRRKLLVESKNGQEV